LVWLLNWGSGSLTETIDGQALAPVVAGRLRVLALEEFGLRA
jgi:hypothetical protein